MDNGRLAWSGERSALERRAEHVFSKGLKLNETQSPVKVKWKRVLGRRRGSARQARARGRARFDKREGTA